MYDDLTVDVENQENFENLPCNSRKFNCIGPLGLRVRV
jgi:hypothetical protein